MKRSLSSLAAVAAGVVAPTALAATAAAAPAHDLALQHMTRAEHRQFSHKSAKAAHRLEALDHRYLKLYNEVQHKFGTRAPGRDIVRDGLTATSAATATAITKSIGTLDGMLAADQVSSATTTTSTVGATTATQSSVAPAASGLTACIIDRESGGDPDAVNASGHMGEGQWNESAWLADGGGAYGATPLDATAAQQEQVIADQVAAGNTGQWTDYDGC